MKHITPPSSLANLYHLAAKLKCRGPQEGERSGKAPLEDWGERMREELLLDVPHRQVVFTIPKLLRIFFKYNRWLLGDLCRCALRSLIHYFEVLAGSELMPGISATIQPFGNRMNLHPLICPQCGGQMKIISFPTDYAVVDRIIDHLKLSFVADKPPPPRLAYQELLMAAVASAEYLS